MTPEEARQVLCETLETDGELFEVGLLVDALLGEREALATLLGGVWADYPSLIGGLLPQTQGGWWVKAEGTA